MFQRAISLGIKRAKDRASEIAGECSSLSGTYLPVVCFAVVTGAAVVIATLDVTLAWQYRKNSNKKLMPCYAPILGML